MHTMAISKNYSVGPHKDGWQMKRDGAGRASWVHETKAEAEQSLRRWLDARDAEAAASGCSAAR